MSSRIYGRGPDEDQPAPPPRTETPSTATQASSFATKLVLWGVLVMIVGLFAMCGIGHIPSGG